MEKWKYKEEYSACQLTADFSGFFKLSLIIGVCFGIGFIPFAYIANVKPDTAGMDYLFLLVFSIIGGPLVGILFGIQSALLGYFPYKWIMKKTQGITVTGKVTGLTENINE
ncbi:MAG: hypothetical protein OEY00_05945 [Gammaproteobacteria bacterium]|nr:hypothetical protein [Gammaproteobacteria bacterium]MDH5732064.1 hypothetical protein [Gammaproteobacteria bacterium]